MKKHNYPEGTVLWEAEAMRIGSGGWDTIWSKRERPRSTERRDIGVIHMRHLQVDTQPLWAQPTINGSDTRCPAEIILNFLTSKLSANEIVIRDTLFCGSLLCSSNGRDTYRCCHYRSLKYAALILSLESGPRLTEKASKRMLTAAGRTRGYYAGLAGEQPTRCSSRRLNTRHLTYFEKYKMDLRN